MATVTSRSLLRKVTLSRLYGAFLVAALGLLLVVPSVLASCTTNQYLQSTTTSSTPSVVTTAFGPNPPETYQDIAVFTTGPNLGKALVTSQGTYGIYTWNLETNGVTSFFDLNSLSHMPSCICLNADNTKVYYGRSYYLYQVDVNTATHEGRLSGYSGSLGTVTGCTVDSDGDIYIAAMTSTRISKLSNTGGSWSMADEWVFSSQNYKPIDVIITADKSTLYWTDEQNRALYKTVISTDETVQLVASSSVYLPYSLTFSSADETSVFISSYYQMWKADLSSPYTLEVFAGPTSMTTGNVDGTGTDARFNQLKGMAISNDYGTLYVADRTNYALRTVTTGYFTSTVSCQACEPGSESPGGDATSCSCIGGYYRAGVDVDGVTTYTGPCTSCDPGYTSLVSDANTGGPDVCFYVCPAGQHVDSGTTCVDCPTDYTSAGGIPDASHCYYNCPAGQYLDSGTTCVNCPTGLTSLAGSQSVEDCGCPGGTYLDAETCTSCPSGSTSSIGSTVVTECECEPGFTGTITSTSDTCEACADGKYKASVGSADCISCNTDGNEYTTTSSDHTQCYCNAGHFRGPEPVVAQDDASFDRTQLDKIDLGSRTWNIADNGGFTAVMKVKFEGDPADGAWHRVFKFVSTDGLMQVAQYSTESAVNFGINFVSSGTTTWCSNSGQLPITYGVWHTIIARWRESDQQSSYSVDDVTKVIYCYAVNMPNMVTNPTLIGGDPNTVQAQHFNGQMAGFYAFDRYLDDTEVALVADNIKIPFDMSTAVVAQDDASFDRTQLNQIDFGPTTWNIADNGGFTAVMKIKFEGNPADGSWSAVFQFGGSGDTDSIVLGQHGSLNEVQWTIRDSTQQCYNSRYDHDGSETKALSVTYGSWHTIVTRWRASDFQSFISVDGVTRTRTCPLVTMTNFASDDNIIGNRCCDNWDVKHFNGQLAGLYAFDRYLDDTEVALVAANIRIGVDAGQNLARSCGATQDQQCPTAASSFYTGYPPSKINSGVTTTWNFWSINWDSGTETAATIYIYVDLEHSADINLVRLYPRENWSIRMNGVEVRVGDNVADPWSNTICGSVTTWTSGDSFTNIPCSGTGQYVFLTWSSLYDGVAVVSELQVFAQATDVSATDGKDLAYCFGCVSGEYKDHVGDDDCTECTTNSETAGTGASAANQCLCSKGYENTEANTESMPSCQACGLGEYKESASNILECVGCPNDATTLHTASFEVTDCQCVAGHEGVISTDTDTCANCQAGTFKSNTGTENCGDCPTGSTSALSSTASTDCTCTETGYTGPNGGPCECAAGYTGENCDACAVNTFKSTTGDAACTPCSSDSSSPSGSTASTDCTCNAGFTGADGGSCDACNANEYKPTTGSAACTGCPTNTVSPSGSDAIEDCVAAAGYYGTSTTTITQCPDNSNSAEGATVDTQCTCNVGYTGPDGGGCTACSEGEYKNSQGNAACTSCGGVAFYSPEASDSSDDCVCALGYTGASCDACETGKYKITTGPAACTPCDSDASSPSASTAASDCDCNIGFFGNGHTTCDACGAGTYQDVSGSTSCKGCTPNSNSAQGSDESTDCVCNEGYAGAHGGPCVVCTAGQYEDTTTHLCETCPINSHSSDGSTLTDCLCNAGYTGPNGGPCNACNVGEYKDATGSSACQDCHAQATSPAGSTSSGCACLPGYTGDGVSCSECLAGKFKDTTDNVACTPCPDYSQSASGATVCLCNAGFTGPADSCDQCGAGTFKHTAGTDACTGCPENTYSPAQSDDVTHCVCNAGYTGPDGLACSECGTGKYKALTGSATCTTCPSFSASPAASTAETDCVCNAGYGGDDGGPCTQCQAGTYENTALNTCITCPDYTNSNAGSDELTDCTCNKGYTGPDGTECTECGVNHYKDTTGSAGCTQCTDFSTSPAASDDVSDCVCNSGYHHAGDGSCDLECAAGYEAGPHELQCLQCPNAKYKTTGGDHSCTTCMDNSHHTELAATSIDACICNHGFYKSIDGQSCNACETGKFNNQAGEGQCFDCFSDTSGSCVSATGTQTECPDLCQAPAGYQVTASGVNLEPCPANTYNDGSFTTCQTCPSPSTYTSSTGSTSVSDCICQPGHFRDNGVCTACAQGSYKSETGDAACNLCVAADSNTNTLTTASTSVSDCLCVANYELRDGSCQACPAGGAKYIIGNDACIDCTDFATLTDNGVHAASSCLCDPGYTGNHLECSACLEGQYKPTSGPDLCSDCVEHATSPAASDSISDCYCPPPLWEDGDPGPTDPTGSCVNACDPGTFKGESDCENCVEGTYKPDTGPHACTPCSLPRNASAAGSDSADDCSCGAGKMGLAGEHTVIQSIGALSEAGLDVQTFTSSSTIPDTNKRYKSLQLTSAIDVTVSITGVVIFKCTTDCDSFGVIPLYNLPGQLQLTMTSGTATITQYTRREVVVTHTPSWYNAAAAEALTLQEDLRVGDFLFNPASAVFSTTVCVTCAPGVVCKPFI